MRSSYVHVFAPAMAAFAYPTGGGHHPAPWQIVHGAGEAVTSLVEIVIEPAAKLVVKDRATALTLMSSMVRLLSGSPVYISAVSQRPLDSASGRLPDTRVDALEPRPAWRGEPVNITNTFVTLFRILLNPAGGLLDEDDFSRAFLLADGVWWLPNRAAQMLAIWTAAEILLRPGDMNKGQGLGRAVRSYIGRSKEDGDHRCNETIRLFKAQGGAIHAGRSVSHEDVYASYIIVRDVLIRSIHEGKRPPLLIDMVPPWKL